MVCRDFILPEGCKPCLLLSSFQFCETYSTLSESKNRYDAFTKRYYIDQIVYIQDEKGITSFPYSVVLQYYEQEEIRSALKDAGFVITGEFQNRNKEPWTVKSQEWIIEAMKN